MVCTFIYWPTGPPVHRPARSPLLTACSTLQACARRLGAVVRRAAHFRGALAAALNLATPRTRIKPSAHKVKVKGPLPVSPRPKAPGSNRRSPCSRKPGPSSPRITGSAHKTLTRSAGSAGPHPTAPACHQACAAAQLRINRSAWPPLRPGRRPPRSAAHLLPPS